MTVQKIFLKEWKKIQTVTGESPRIVVAVSGGVDSMVLLHLIQEVVPASKIAVAHFDHRVRASSKKEALWLSKRCRELGIPHFFWAHRRGKHTSEEFLRKERHAFLEKIRKQQGASVIALAHHANDQLETVIMRLVRGSGVSGLGAMTPQTGHLVRPLLSLSKSDLSRFAKDQQIKHIEDESNGDCRYFRNQIRHKVIPNLVEVSSQYGGESKLLRRVTELTSEIHQLRKENTVQASEWILQRVTRTPFWVSFSREEWLLLSSQVRKQVALQLWALVAHETLETKELSLLGNVIERQKAASLSGRVSVRVSCGLVYLLTPENQQAIEKVRTSRSLLDFYCRRGSKLKLKALLKRSQAEVRLLQPGDRFRTKKMKRLCLELAIPAPERALLPVVAKPGSKDLLWHFPIQDAFGDCLKLPWKKK